MSSSLSVSYNIPMADGFSGVESALNLLQAQAEYVSHSYSYDIRALTQLCGKVGTLCGLKSQSPWIYEY